MKKLLVFLLLTLGAFAQTAVIDMDYLVNNHPKFSIVKKDIEAEKVRLETVLNTKSDELSLEYEKLKAKGEAVTAEEKTNFSKKDSDLKELFQGSQQSLSAFEDKKIADLVTEIKTAVLTLSKKNNYDAIVEKKAVYFGLDKLTDISEDVLKVLKTSEKIILK